MSMPSDQEFASPTEEARDDATSDAVAWVTGAAELVAEQTRAHPVRTLAAAFGVGYVLGGGLPRFVVRIGTLALLRSAGAAIAGSDTVTQLVQRVVSASAAEKSRVTRRSAR